VLENILAFKKVALVVTRTCLAYIVFSVFFFGGKLMEFGDGGDGQQRT
jgi:hypothetical protein